MGGPKPLLRRNVSVLAVTNESGGRHIEANAGSLPTQPALRRCSISRVRRARVEGEEKPGVVAQPWPLCLLHSRGSVWSCSEIDALTHSISCECCAPCALRAKPA